MKIITTIEVITKAWDVLKKANLQSIMNGPLEMLNIRVNPDMITDLLNNGVLIELLQVITGAEKYVRPDGSMVEWQQLDIWDAADLLHRFFTSITACLPKRRA